MEKDLTEQETRRQNTALLPWAVRDQDTLRRGGGTASAGKKPVSEAVMARGAPNPGSVP